MQLLGNVVKQQFGTSKGKNHQHYSALTRTIFHPFFPSGTTNLLNGSCMFPGLQICPAPAQLGTGTDPLLEMTITLILIQAAAGKHRQKLCRGAQQGTK